MTPLAIQHVLKFGTPKVFQGCQFFDLTSLFSMIEVECAEHRRWLEGEIADAKGSRVRPFGERRYAPADRCWFEFTLDTGREAIFLERVGDGFHCASIGEGWPLSEGEQSYIYDDGAFGNPEGTWGGFGAAVGAYAILGLLARRDLVESRRLPSRFTSKQKRLIPHPPTVVFREIRLRPSRRSVSDGAVSEGPAKPLHFVLGHPRRLPGRTIYIPGHWKGCQSLGVVLHRYVSEGGEMKRLPDDGTLGKMTAREALAIVRPDVILPPSLTGEPQ